MGGIFGRSPEFFEHAAKPLPAKRRIPLLVRGLLQDRPTEQRATMVAQDELDDFRALSLILQHRVLLRGLDAIEAVIESCRSSEAPPWEAAARLLSPLRTFTQALPTHFATESKSTASLLRGCREDFAHLLRRLDSEHPHLLARFQDSVAHFAAHHARSNDASALLPFERALADLVLAIEAFRRHEAAEDALFAD